MSKITFAATVKVPSSKTSDDDLDVVVTADITPGDPGGRHCPPSGPIPEICEVIIDPHANVDGTHYERGEDVILLLGEEDIYQLEDHAVSAWIEEERGLADVEPPDDDDPSLRAYEEEYLTHFKEEAMKKQKTPIPNRKGRTPPRGLNVRGLPRHVLAYLSNTAKARGLNTEAYVRSEIIRHVDEKLNPQVAPVPGYNIGPPANTPGSTMAPPPPGTFYTS